MSDARTQYAGMRSILEVPILNERYWSKVPDAPADAIMIDFEDSAVPEAKDEVRARALDWLARPEYFGGRPVIVRVNHLSTPWGEADLEALGTVGTDIIVSYPKIESVEEIATTRGILERHGRAAPGLHVMIETARAVLDIREIASAPGLVGLHYGYVDLAADIGARPFDGDALYDAAAGYARTVISTAAAAFGLFATGGSLIPDFRDLDKVRDHVRMWRDVGYTAVIAVSPNHLTLINELMSPNEEDVDAARKVCAAYEDAVSAGAPAAVLDGKVITLPDFRVAARVLARAGLRPAAD